jgi:hypothetical protein
MSPVTLTMAPTTQEHARNVRRSSAPTSTPRRGHAEHVGLGERVAEDRLERDADERQPSAGHRAEEDARQPRFHHDGVVDRIGHGHRAHERHGLVAEQHGERDGDGQGRMVRRSVHTGDAPRS